MAGPVTSTSGKRRRGKERRRKESKKKGRDEMWKKGNRNTEIETKRWEERRGRGEGKMAKGEEKEKRAEKKRRQGRGDKRREKKKKIQIGKERRETMNAKTDRKTKRGVKQEKKIQTEKKRGETYRRRKRRIGREREGGNPSPSRDHYVGRAFPASRGTPRTHTRVTSFPSPARSFSFKGEDESTPGRPGDGRRTATHPAHRPASETDLSWERRQLRPTPAGNDVS